jgi:sugar/nucleoside kinase (ribokinase family)
VVGLGLNATDTVMIVQSFPAVGGKERVVSSSMQAGGQVATAMVACRRWGLKARYIGKVGNDAGGRLQLASLRREGVDTSYVRTVRGATSQYGHIVVDLSTGERTVFWDRDAKLAVQPRELKPSAITSARGLLVDGCDTDACLTAARWARQANLPVVADLDTVYPHVEKLAPQIDYLIASLNFLPTFTGHSDPFKALKHVAREYKVRAPGLTLGRDGALIYEAGRFHYSPGFVVEAVDTTGAGDVFHGAFIYGVLAGWNMARTLDFSNALAGLNCTALGARGGIKSLTEAERLIATGARHINPDYQRGRVSGRKAGGRARL